MENTQAVFFENIQLKNLVSEYTKCWPEWKGINCKYGYNKFYYFLGGSGTLIIDGEKYKPQPEELYLIPTNTVHSHYNDSEDCFTKYWCHFYAKVNEGELFSYFNIPLKCHISKEKIIPMFKKLIGSSNSNNPLDVLTEKAAMLEIIKLYFENIDYIMRDQFLMDKNLELRINKYINDNINTHITLNELASIAHLHPNYFISYFKKYFSITPIQYVNQVRLQKAVYLLKNKSNHTIEDIARESGFNDYRYFSRLFKTRYGMSPTNYRKY